MRKVLLLGLALLIASATAFAQSRVVTGTVTSEEDGLPIPGASIMVKGTTVGTATDLDGRFSLNIPQGSNTLVVTFIGSVRQEVSIGNRSQIDIVLQPDITSLSEVIVTGYGSQPKREVTGAVSSVRGEAIENLPMQSFDRALQGRAAGVQVRSSSGLPGGAVNIRVRGVGSVTAGNEPLFIVDGVQLNNQDNSSFTQANPLAFLNPNDIESMEILKDAASAAIYGSQAANGVVIITTKKGKQGKAKFTFNAFTGSTEPIKYMNMLSGPEWYEMRRDALVRGGSSFPELRALNAMGLIALTNANTGIPAAELDAMGAALDTYDWQREVMGRGNLQNYEMSVSGGDTKTQFFLSGSYNYQESTFRPVDFERGTFRINVKHQANERLNLETSFNFATVGQEAPFAVEGAFLGNPAFSASAILPHNPIYNEDGSYNQNIGGVLGQNIVMVNDYNSGSVRTNTVVGNFIATYKLADNLTFRSLYGLDYRVIQEQRYRDPRTPDGAGVRGRATAGSDWRTRFITTQTLNWNKTYSSVHNVSGIAGVEYVSETREGISGESIGFPSEAFRYVNSGAEPTFVGGFWTGYRRIGAFASANYDYNKKYLLTVTARYDGSSRFGLNTRYGLFPSIRGGWYLKEEEFLKNNSTVSDLKLRASWGRTGNDQIGNFAARGLYGVAGNYALNPGIRPSGLANLDLGWETNETINLGIDFGLFDNRVSGSVDLFDRTTKDLILSQPILWTNGFGAQSNNVGSLRNRGIEFEIQTVNIDKGNFSWRTQFNFTYIKNEIISLFDGLQELPSNPGIAIGQSVGNPPFPGAEAPGSWFTQEYAGVNPATGRPMWLDANGNRTSLPLASDRKYFGSTLAPYYGGFNNTFKYKGVELTAFFTYEYGAVVSDGQYNFLRENGTRLALNAIREVNDRAWTEPGQITDIPRIYLATTNANEVRSQSRQFGSASLLNASFIRLAQLQVAYNFNPSLVRRLGLDRAKVYAQGMNLFTYSDFPGYDPEFAGGSTGILPITRNYIIGIQLGF
ncbi:SusC/RagA family TonB-linked outer membrane protein [Belliella marina]|uniref:SusC/RagA family TonB-linked outer membrane protein n=1 Tax=Belliella marina TaxID=1644146 RepID=A0ABW4VUH8_9BACT